MFGDQEGGEYFLELIGLTLGPIISTAYRKDPGLMIHCPACQQDHPIKKMQLDSELTCQTTGCGVRLRLNPFTVGHPEIYENQVAQPLEEPQKQLKKQNSPPWYKVIDNMGAGGTVTKKCLKCGDISSFEPRKGVSNTAHCPECKIGE